MYLTKPINLTVNSEAACNKPSTPFGLTFKGSANYRQPDVFDLRPDFNYGQQDLQANLRPGSILNYQA